MARALETISNLDRRLPEAGRIRFGEKGPKGEPRKLTVFRLTSHDEQAIREVADFYGGEPRPWVAMPGQWEVTTEAKEIPVVLPPDPLGGTPIYELWSGGGVLRRCDGETCLVPTRIGDGAEMVEKPCICVEREVMECKPKTRLTVLLPEIRFIGGWRLESGGWNVAHELPGMVDMIAQLQDRGLLRATLALEARTSKMAGQTRQFVVPVLRPDVSLNQILAGEGQVRGLAKAPTLEPLQELTTGLTTFASDDDVADAEIIVSTTGAVIDVELAVAEAEDGHPDIPEGVQKRRRKMHALLKELGMGVMERHALVMRITNGRHSSSNDLDEPGLDMLLAALGAMKKAEAFFDGVDSNGMAIVTRRVEA